MEAFRLTSRVRAPSRVTALSGLSGLSGLSRSSASSKSSGSSSWGRSRVRSVDAGPHEAAVPVPVPVPWTVTARSASGVIEIEHQGAGPLRAVRFILAGGGLIGLSLPRTIYPGERVRVVVRGVHADGAISAADAMLVLRWVEPNGTELLWPIAL